MVGFRKRDEWLRVNPHLYFNQLLSHVRSQIDGTDLIRIRVRHPNREDAMDIIRTLLDVFAKEQKEKWEQTDEQIEKRKLRAAIGAQEKVFANLRQELQRLEGDSFQSSEVDSDLQQRIDQEVEHLQGLRLKFIGGTIHDEIEYQGIMIHDEPLIPEHPISPNVRLNLILGAVIGVFAGPILAFFLAWMRRPVAARL